MLPSRRAQAQRQVEVLRVGEDRLVEAAHLPHAVRRYAAAAPAGPASRRPRVASPGDGQAGQARKARERAVGAQPDTVDQRARRAARAGTRPSPYAVRPPAARPGARASRGGSTRRCSGAPQPRRPPHLCRGCTRRRSSACLRSDQPDCGPLAAGPARRSRRCRRCRRRSPCACGSAARDATGSLSSGHSAPRSGSRCRL